MSSPFKKKKEKKDPHKEELDRLATFSQDQLVSDECKHGLTVPKTHIRHTLSTARPGVHCTLNSQQVHAYLKQVEAYKTHCQLSPPGYLFSYTDDCRLTSRTLTNW